MATIDPEDVKLLVKVQQDLRAKHGDEWNFYDGARRFLAVLADRLLPRDATHTVQLITEARDVDPGLPGDIVVLPTFRRHTATWTEPVK